MQGVTGLNSSHNVRLVKGSHIVVPKFWEGPQAYLFQHTDGRVIFVNPYEGDFCLIGTTDTPYEGSADDVAIDDGEIDYLLSAVNRYMRRGLTRGDIRHSFSGVRPLYDDRAANPSAVTRDSCKAPRNWEKSVLSWAAVGLSSSPNDSTTFSSVQDSAPASSPTCAHDPLNMRSRRTRST